MNSHRSFQNPKAIRGSQRCGSLRAPFPRKRRSTASWHQQSIALLTNKLCVPCSSFLSCARYAYLQQKKLMQLLELPEPLSCQHFVPKHLPASVLDFSIHSIPFSKAAACVFSETWAWG